MEFKLSGDAASSYDQFNATYLSLACVQGKQRVFTLNSTSEFDLIARGAPLRASKLVITADKIATGMANNHFSPEI